MSDLRSLGYTFAVTAQTTNYPTEFVVWNNSLSPGNGGCCCLWTVPSGTTWITFEMWGGGGGGGGSCCCMQGDGGGSGAYAVKTVCNGNGLTGCQYTICAGGTSCVTPGGGQSYGGNTSYVNGYGLSNFCAAGGNGGCSLCFRWGSCYICQLMCCCAQACGADLMVPGYSGQNIQSTFCYSYSQGFGAVAASTVSGPMVGANGCTLCGCGAISIVPPGAGGFTAVVLSLIHI